MFGFAENEEASNMDQSVLLLTISVFIVSAPRDVVFVPNLLGPATTILKHAWDSENMAVSLCLLY